MATEAAMGYIGGAKGVWWRGHGGSGTGACGDGSINGDVGGVVGRIGARGGSGDAGGRGGGT